MPGVDRSSRARGCIVSNRQANTVAAIASYRMQGADCTVPYSVLVKCARLAMAESPDATDSDLACYALDRAQEWLDGRPFSTDSEATGQMPEGGAK